MNLDITIQCDYPDHEHRIIIRTSANDVNIEHAEGFINSKVEPIKRSEVKQYIVIPRSVAMQLLIGLQKALS